MIKGTSLSDHKLSGKIENNGTLVSRATEVWPELADQSRTATL